MLFLRVIVWCGAEKFSLKKSCFYLYIRRRHEPRRNPPADSRRMGTVRTSSQKPNVYQPLVFIKTQKSIFTGQRLWCARDRVNYFEKRKIDS